MSIITANDLARFDLNLLLVLHAVLEEGNVTRAARRLHVGQSAVSNSLAKLRSMFEDPLLVRSGRGLTRTPKALALMPLLEETVTHIARLMQSQRAFIPAQETRQFVLAGDDAIEVCELPKLLVVLRERMPRAGLRFVSIDRLIATDGLASGEVDLALGPRVAFGPGNRYQPLFRQGALLAMRRDHPLAGKRIGREAFNSLAHIDTWIAHGEPGVGHRQASAQLARLGLVRNVALVVSHFSAAATAAAATDLVAGLPERLARFYATVLPLALSPFPAPLRFEMEIGMGWHERTHHDPGSRAFRELVVAALGEKRSAIPPPRTVSGPRAGKRRSKAAP